MCPPFDDLDDAAGMDEADAGAYFGRLGGFVNDGREEAGVPK
jgi:hypothetical protein